MMELAATPPAATMGPASAAPGGLYSSGHQLIADGPGEVPGQGSPVQGFTLLLGVVSQVHHGGFQAREAHVQVRAVYMSPGQVVYAPWDCRASSSMGLPPG